MSETVFDTREHAGHAFDSAAQGRCPTPFSRSA